MRFVTVNLYNGRADPASLKDLLDHLQPDLIGCQEVSANVAEVLADHFPYGLAEPDDDCTGRALMSTHPIEVKKVELPGRPALSTELGGIRVVSVHLSNPVDGPASIRQRRLQVEGVLQEVAGAGRAIVMGDFNATPWWPAYRMVAARLVDGVEASVRGLGGRPASTWNLRPGWPPLLRIDHVFVRDVTLTNCLVRPVAGSDHRALAFEAV